MSVDYEVRELETVAEHVECYRLRYSVYRGLGYVDGPDGAGLELDEFELRAVPFGAFEIRSGELVGTLRMVTQARQERHGTVIRHIVADCGDGALRRRVHAVPDHPLPSLTNPALRRALEVLNPRQLPVVELSRTVVRPDHRGATLSGALIMYGMATAGWPVPQVMIGSCLPEHLPYYGRYGFRPLPGTGVDRVECVGRVGYTVGQCTDRLTGPAADQVRELLGVLRSGSGVGTLVPAGGPPVRYRFR